MPSLQFLEGENWGDPSEGETSLIRTCLQLRRKNLEEFSVEDTRMLLLQGIGTEHLVPKALEFLSDDPLAEGDHYPGDLLNALLQPANGLVVEKHTSQVASVCRQTIAILEDARTYELDSPRFINDETATLLIKIARDFLSRAERN